MGDEGEEYYGYFIGEEDKGLLDPAWERQQKKVNLTRNYIDLNEFFK